MGVILMPGTAEMNTLSLSVKALKERNDYMGLWQALKKLPPLLAIEAFQWIPNSWVPPDENEASLFLENGPAIRRAQLTDFEQLARSENEALWFPKTERSEILEATPDGSWILRCNAESLQILDPLSFEEKHRFQFKTAEGDVTEPQKITVSNDSKLLAVLSLARKNISYQLSIISLETFEYLSSSIVSTGTCPALAFRSNGQLLLAGMFPIERNVQESSYLNYMIEQVKVYEKQETLEENDRLEYDSLVSHIKQLQQESEDLIKSLAESIDLGKSAELDVFANIWTKSLITESQISLATIATESQLLAIATKRLVGHCAMHEETDLKVIRLSDGKNIASFPNSKGQILNLIFVYDEKFLICESAYEVTIYKTQDWSEIQKYDKTPADFTDPRPSSASNGEKNVFAFISGRHDGRDSKVQIVELPDLSVISEYPVYGLRAPDSDFARRVELLTICGPRVVMETDYAGIHSLTFSARKGTWEYATKLRRISCIPLNLLDREHINTINEAANEKWLSEPQRHWVQALKSCLALIEGE